MKESAIAPMRTLPVTISFFIVVAAQALISDWVEVLARVEARNHIL
jgi:hypothetical protein